jgi:hypothetical protein
MESNELYARLGISNSDVLADTGTGPTTVPGTITQDDVITQTNNIKPTAFKKFELNDVVSNQVYPKTNGMWSNSSSSINTFFTSSVYTSTQKEYYLTVLSSTSSCDYQEEFYIAYGNLYGSGSLSQGGQTNDNPSRAIYSQFRNILLDPEDSAFSFPSGSTPSATPTFVDSDSIYIISFNQKLSKDKVDPGNWELSLSPLTGSTLPNNQNTSSAINVSSSLMITLIDNSNDTFGVSPSLIGTVTRPYYVYSGSLENGIYESDGEAFGLFYPDYGVIILNAKKLNSTLGFNTVTGSNINGNNPQKLFTSISGSSTVTFARPSLTGSFYARNFEVKNTSYYYIRSMNYEFNYSNNPTFVTGSQKSFRFDSFKYDPRVYITSVGLYNDAYELLAVAKLSIPIQKSFTDEYLVTVKLEY